MQLYLYSSQDLILDSNALHNVKADNFYSLDINQTETIKIYPTQSSGIMLINYDTLCQMCHSQIIYHQLNNNAILCEIKPFINLDNSQDYTITGGAVTIYQHSNQTYIYFNGAYYGCIKQSCSNIKFEKINKREQECGVIFIDGYKKYLILFLPNQILFCGQYVDYEQTSQYIQIYCHIPNIFNVGTLIKYNFESAQLEHKTVRDMEDIKSIDNKDFNIISFMEAVKCGRYKYAHKILSYELKREISEDVLRQYFKTFDRYEYLFNEDLYITLHNHSVVGTYRFATKFDIIDNIY